MGRICDIAHVIEQDHPNFQASFHRLLAHLSMYFAFLGLDLEWSQILLSKLSVQDNLTPNPIDVCSILIFNCAFKLLVWYYCRCLQWTEY